MNSQTLEQRMLDRPQTYSCDSCERTSDEPVVKSYRHTATAGWQIYCKLCMCMHNPVTGEFDLPRPKNTQGRPRKGCISFEPK
jgi:hypothetical protein